MRKYLLLVPAPMAMLVLAAFFGLGLLLTSAHAEPPAKKAIDPRAQAALDLVFAKPDPFAAPVKPPQPSDRPSTCDCGKDCAGGAHCPGHCDRTTCVNPAVKKGCACTGLDDCTCSESCDCAACKNATRAAKKKCPCSPQCTCGCNEGKPCRCGNVLPTSQSQSLLPYAPAQACRNGS